MVKKITSLILIISLLTCIAGCSAKRQNSNSTDETRTFTDSTGRTFNLPENLEHVAVTGPMAQMLVFALAPDMLVGLASQFPSSAEGLIDSKYISLPTLGQLYGGKGELNLETLLASGAQIVIDVGETKDGIGPELDELENQTGIPFIHISSSLSSAGESLRTLGTLLGRSDDAETLATFCDEIYSKMLTLSENVKKKSILYCLGENGTNVIAANSYHSEVLDLLANNLAVFESPSSKGTGNESDMEQIMLWNPDVIIFDSDSVYGEVADSPVWQQLHAISSGNYYEVPYDLRSFMSFPPGIQRYLGLLWLSNVLYPESVDFDLYTEIARYYELFYHCLLSPERFENIMSYSLK